MHRETYALDGRQYEIETEPLAEGFKAHWHCPTCDKHGESPQVCDSEVEAIGRAMARVFSDHHVPAHAMTH